MSIKLVYTSILGISLLWSGCSVSETIDQNAGTYTTTEDSIAGIVVDPAGNPVEGVSVELIKDDYGVLTAKRSIAAKSAATYELSTDAQGVFHFPDGGIGRPFVIRMYKETQTDTVLIARVLYEAYDPFVDTIPMALKKRDFLTYLAIGYDSITEVRGAVAVSSSATVVSSQVMLSSSSEVVSESSSSTGVVVTPISSSESSSSEAETSSVISYNDKVVELSFQIDRADHDAYENEDSLVVTKSNAPLELGSLLDSSAWVVLLFENVPLSKSDSIEEAYLQFWGNSAGTESNCTVRGIRNAEGLSLDTLKSIDSLGLVGLSSEVQEDARIFDWISSGTWGPNDSLAGRSENIKDVLIGILQNDSGEWESYNTLGLVLTCNGYREVESYDSNPNLAPTLTLRFRTKIDSE
ncbi:MAG: carboxypeptidase-like regulatory domain-containing protein [Fibrobacterales bacterium]